MLALGSEAFQSVSVHASKVSHAYPSQTSSFGPLRNEQHHLSGGVRAVLFDFDGTLTATPGDRAARKFKIAELKERAPMLHPRLQKIRDAGMTLGILSKSSQDTIMTALGSAGLRDLFDGPIQAKAVGLEGKAGFIAEMCTSGGLAHFGAGGLSRVLLVDDDVNELARAWEASIQTYPAPADGGLQEYDFDEIFRGLGIIVDVPAPEGDPLEILTLFTCGKVGEGLGLNTETTQIKYEQGDGPKVTDYYEVQTPALDSSCPSIGSMLGKGSFGVIRPTRHIATNLLCAMKTIRKDVAGRHYVKNFIEDDEYTFLLKLTRQDPNPYVLKQFDYLVGSKLVYNAMEILNGLDLFAYMSEKAPLTESFVRHSMRMLFQAMQHIHGALGRGLIHRDVKMENLRFRDTSPSSDLVLVDFGLSCPASPSQKRGVVGTLLYMAPEIFSGEYTTQVDVWSAGVLFYVVLTGRPPWTLDAEKGLSANAAVLNGSNIEAAMGAPEVGAAPVAATALLRALLLLDPGKRLNAAAALKHPWFKDKESDARLSQHDGLKLAIPGSTYASYRQQTTGTPCARLGFLLDEGDPSTATGSQDSIPGVPSSENKAAVPNSKGIEAAPKAICCRIC